MSSPSNDFLVWRLFGLESARLSGIERALVRVALAMGLLVVAFSYLDNREYAGVDLRNRVVGARVMLAGYDPYAFVWESGMPEEWLDPVYDAKAHRLTISPPTLLLYAVPAPLPYAVQRFGSFVAEWLALIASLALLARCLSEQRQRAVFLLGATLFVIATDVWRLHLERGQVYVLHLLSLSVALYCSRCGQVDSLASGVALGVLGLMRPNLLVMAPALVLLRQWRGASALLTTVGVGLVATFVVAPSSSWPSYLDVGDQYYRAIQDRDSVPDRPRPVSDGWAEGSNFDRALSGVESSSFAVLWQKLHESHGLPMIDVALTSKIALLILATSLLALLWLWRGADTRSAFALMLVLSVDTEFFLPHRWGYADVMLLAPLALLLPTLLRHPFALGVVALGLVSGLLGQQFIGLHAATVIRSWLVMGVLTWMMTFSARATSGER